MKATYIFSEQQKQRQIRNAKNGKTIYSPTYVDGQEYTELLTLDGEQVSNWPDAVVVKVVEGLPFDEHLGRRYAKIY